MRILLVVESRSGQDTYLIISIDVTAIIFVVASSSFNMVIQEDKSTVSLMCSVVYHYHAMISATVSGVR